MEIVGNCLRINGAQSVRLGKATIEFKNYCRQIHCSFKIYCDFACNLGGVEIYERFYSSKYHNHIPCSFAYKIALMIDLVNRLLFLGVKTLLMNLLKQFLRSINTLKKVMKKHFNKNLIITEEEEKEYQSSNTCCICKKLIDLDDEKARDHCHVTGRFIGAAHWSCSIFN